MLGNFISELLVISIATLSGTTILFWLIYRAIGNKRRGLATLTAVLIWPLLSVLRPDVLIITALPLMFGYLIGRPTKLPADPTDTFSKSVKVTGEVYVSKMEEMVSYTLSQRGSKFFLGQQFHWTEKLSYISHIFRYLLFFKKAPGVTLSMASVFSLFLSLGGPSHPLSLLCGFFLGVSLANLVKCVKAQPPDRKYRAA